MDRLSNLPDEIVAHILSFLPIEEAVRTSILSSRWRYMFRLITSLCFDDSFIVYNSRDYEGQCLCFKEFVYRVMKLRMTSNIKKFSVKCRHRESYGGRHVHEWIRAAISRGVQEICLDFGHFIQDFLPRRLFNCQTLVVLQLSFWCRKVTLEISPSVSLPNVKVIHLRRIQLTDAINRLFSGCPSLEDLSLEGYRRTDSLVHTISIPPLKTLTLHGLDPASSSEETVEIKIDAPNLVYFKCTGDISESYSLKNSNALAEAVINASCLSKSHLLLALIRAVSNVKVMHLLGHSLKSLNHGDFNDDKLELPMFCNLSRLELDLGIDTWEYGGWELLPELLAAAPKLETLVFTKGLLDYCSRHEDGFPSLPVLPISSCLKVIEVNRFRGHRQEFYIAEYLLRNAKVLNQMILHKTQMTMEEGLHARLLTKKCVFKGFRR
ncbi:hypothetical protein Nepgr_026179 [Nepenthes gracilis]|uniref:F-box domain-containing protein n=1 Tax=Nepenthes gracilis TaxID=150966 RepID=A0AAD3T9A8_NEPGR|nr:hypothetical protein Nepgr_026179 [Nepenthes gracilis]